MNKKPVIGILASASSEKEPEFREFANSSVSNAYVQSVICGGGIPSIIPITKYEELVPAQIEFLDGVIFTGGCDVNPLFYGEEPHEKLGNITPERDWYEKWLLETADKKKIPVLGICRGHQAINILYGGNVYQDISLSENAWIKHRQSGAPETGTHTVKLKEGSWLHSLFGDTVKTNSYHHQAVNRLGDNLDAVGWSSDGLIEAFEKKGDNFCVCVQWHPEMMINHSSDMQKLFKEFVNVVVENTKR